MVNWMVSLARRHDSDRSLDFLRVIVTRQRDAVLQADRAGDYARVASRIELFDATFPFSMFDQMTLPAHERQAVRDWLQTTIEARRKLHGREPGDARHIRRDEALLRRWSRADQN
jgi:hypothetical protein